MSANDLASTDALIRRLRMAQERQKRIITDTENLLNTAEQMRAQIVGRVQPDLPGVGKK